MKRRLFHSFMRLPWTPRLPPGDGPALVIATQTAEDEDLGLTCLLNGVFRLPRDDFDHGRAPSPLPRLQIAAINTVRLTTASCTLVEQQLNRAPDTRSGAMHEGAFSVNLFDQLGIDPPQHPTTVVCAMAHHTSNLLTLDLTPANQHDDDLRTILTPGFAGEVGSNIEVKEADGELALMEPDDDDQTVVVDSGDELALMEPDDDATVFVEGGDELGLMEPDDDDQTIVVEGGGGELELMEPDDDDATIDEGNPPDRAEIAPGKGIETAPN